MLGCRSMPNLCRDGTRRLFNYSMCLFSFVRRCLRFSPVLDARPYIQVGKHLAIIALFASPDNPSICYSYCLHKIGNGQCG